MYYVHTKLHRGLVTRRLCPILKLCPQMESLVSFFIINTLYCDLPGQGICGTHGDRVILAIRPGSYVRLGWAGGGLVHSRFRHWTPLPQTSEQLLHSGHSEASKQYWALYKNMCMLCVCTFAIRYARYNACRRMTILSCYVDAIT